MTAVLNMLDDWSEDYENHKSNAILVLDQSTTYDIICHVKLLEKLKIIGFDRNSVELFKSYKQNRNQTVTVESFQSETLDTNNTNENNDNINKTLEKIIDYMNSNSLVLNKEKSKILIISENPDIKKREFLYL